MAATLRDGDEVELRALLPLALSDNERARVRYLLGDPASQGTLVDGLTPTELDGLYAAVGCLAALDAPGGRDADFARNQGQGAWAEGLLAAYAGDHRFVEFGTSNPISPSASGYATARRRHRYVELYEAKRPDFLLIPTATLAADATPLSWHERVLTTAESAALASIVTCAVEVKSSLWDFSAREAFRETHPDLPSISITLKEEELPALITWERKARVPIVIVQAFVDSMHACSLSRFLEYKRRGRTRAVMEPKTTKLTHRLHLPSDGSWGIADISTSGFRFATTSRGVVTAPRLWPAATLINVDLSRIVAAEQRLKHDLAAH